MHVYFLPEIEPNLLTSSVWFGSVQSAPGRVSWVLFFLIFLCLFILIIIIVIFCYCYFRFFNLFLPENRTEPTDQFSLVRLDLGLYGSSQNGIYIYI